ncbi:hypothetical protein HQQ80_13280 [Microbacteriaceae bacterium VKM Ac-2855]|nr:hypothetical protein [Microbacteriaceae bacterium VKM Ac-2855]
MQTRWARFARGWLAAVVATTTAAASHTLGGGQAPAFAAIALALAFAGMLCVLLAGKTLSVLRLSASVLLSQLGYHLLFLLAPGGVAVEASGQAAMHQHGAAETVLLSTDAGMAAHAGHDLGMYLAHALAAIVTVVALRHGERTFWTLGDALVGAVVRIVARTSAALAPVARPHALRPFERIALPHPLDDVLSALRHRGPPRGALAAV